MTDKIDAKQTEELEDTQEIEIEATEDTDADANEQSGAESIETKVTVRVMSEDKFFTGILQTIKDAAKQQPRTAELYRNLQIANFGPDVPAQEAENAPISDERQRNLVISYVLARFSDINDYAISLKEKDVNSAISQMFEFVGLHDIPIASLKPEYYDSMFGFRTSMVPLLQNEYEILQINRDVAELYKSKSGTYELSDKIINMEDYRAKDYINREQLARFYYNIGAVYDAYSSQRNTKDKIDDELDFSMLYKRKALAMTRRNIALILDVHRDWKPRNDYEPQEILDACHRVIDSSADERTLYRAHILYAETLRDFKGTDGFSNKRDKRLTSIAKHYCKALNYTNNDDEKVDLLNLIAEQYKKLGDQEEYIGTKLEMISLLHYRDRIRECKRLGEEIADDDVENKKFVYEAAINEYNTLTGIDKEDRQRYDELDDKYRKMLGNSDEDKETIKLLNHLKKKYGTSKSKNQGLISRISSSGHDFFALKIKSKGKSSR